LDNVESDAKGMKLGNKQVTKFLFAAEGIGVIFVALFSIAYLGGLPTTAVLHSEPFLRIPLAIFGALLLVLVLSALAISYFVKKE
jgi:hypothetical protein